MSFNIKMRVSQIRMVKQLLIVHYLDPNILSIEILEHIKPARWASLINFDPLQQALLVEHMLTLNLKQILALAQVGDADGAFFFGHFGSEGNGVDAITDGLPYLVLLETNAALSETQVDAGEEGADERVHVDEEVAVEVGELGGHDSPDIVAIIIINMIKREDGFDGGGRAGDDAGHSETPLDEGVGVTEHEEDEHHGDDEEVDEQEASEPQFRRLHQVLMLGQGEMGEEEQGSERNCCHHTPGDLDMGYHYYIISPPRPIGFLTNSPTPPAAAQSDRRAWAPVKRMNMGGVEDERGGGDEGNSKNEASGCQQKWSRLPLSRFRSMLRKYSPPLFSPFSTIFLYRLTILSLLRLLLASDLCSSCRYVLVVCMELLKMDWVCVVCLEQSSIQVFSFFKHSSSSGQQKSVQLQLSDICMLILLLIYPQLLYLQPTLSDYQPPLPGLPCTSLLQLAVPPGTIITNYYNQTGYQCFNSNIRSLIQMNSKSNMNNKVVSVFHQAPAHQPQSNFLSAGAYFVQLGIPEQPASRVLVDVAVSSQSLDGLQRHLCSTLRSEVYYTRTVQVGQVPFIHHPAAAVQHCPRRLQLRVHFCNLALHQLEVPYWFSELLPCFNVAQSDVQGRLHNANRACCKYQPFIIQPAHQNVNTFVKLTQNILFWHFHVFEHKLTSIGPSHAQFVQFLSARKPFHALLNNKCSDSFVLLRWFGLGIYHQNISVGTVRNPHFGSIQDILIPFLLCPELHGCYIGTCSGLGHCQCSNVLS